MATGHRAPDPAKPSIANSMGKASILMEALPYIKRFRGEVVLIKYGGSTMEDPALRDSFAGDVTLLHTVGIRPVIVHGGGPQISQAMSEAGIEPTWLEGLRVTDDQAIRIVQRVLIGEVNADIVAMLAGHGARAIGVSGLDASFLIAEAIDERLGHVGSIAAVNVDLIERLLDDGLIPVVAPLARGMDGTIYNTNADTAAGAIAAELRARKLVFLTDVEGVYRDRTDPSTRITRLDVDALRELLPNVEGGMLPKLQSVAGAVDSGVRRAHILDGRVQHAVLLEMFTQEGIGTMVTRVGDERV